MSAPTESEALFESFCISNRLDWKRLMPSHRAGERTPDYEIQLRDSIIEIEIKEIKSREGFYDDGSGSRTVGKHVRGAIEAAKKQVQTSFNRGNPSLLLVYNAIDPWQLFGTEQHDFLAAMYGELTLHFSMKKNAFSAIFHGRNAKLRHDTHTSFGGIGHLI